MRDLRKLGNCRLFVNEFLLIQIPKFGSIETNSEVGSKHPLMTLANDAVKGLLQLFMGGGQLPEVSMSFQDGDDQLVDFINRLVQSSLGKRRKKIEENLIHWALGNGFIIGIIISYSAGINS